MRPEFDIASVPRDRIVAVIAALAARFVAESVERPAVEHEASAAALLDAKQMGERLNVRESWVRSEARSGRIPCIEIGRYIRFDVVAVMAALAAKQTALVDNHSALVNYGRGGTHCHENQASKKSRRGSSRTLGRQGQERSQDSGSAG